MADDSSVFCRGADWPVAFSSFWSGQLPTSWRPSGDGCAGPWLSRKAGARQWFCVDLPPHRRHLFGSAKTALLPGLSAALRFTTPSFSYTYGVVIYYSKRYLRQCGSALGQAQCQGYNDPGPLYSPSTSRGILWESQQCLAWILSLCQADEC